MMRTVLYSEDFGDLYPHKQLVHVELIQWLGEGHQDLIIRWKVKVDGLFIATGSRCFNENESVSVAVRAATAKFDDLLESHPRKDELERQP